MAMKRIYKIFVLGCRRLPEPGVKRHPGGYGMYYHVDLHGAPRAYQWLNMTQIQHMWEQLYLTYAYGVDKMWILNVGDLKPNEFPTDFFLKMAAAEIFRNVTQLNDEEEIKAKVVHLSTNMCPAHRRKAIDDIRRMLDNNERVICITTQLIEAGVDISFKCVIRSSAGLDNIAQAAGRCNRNGEDDRRNVYIIKLKDEYIEKLGKLKEAQRQCGLIVRKYGCEQLLSVDIMKRYFRDYYEDCACDSNGDMLEYQIRNSNYSLLDLLSCNIIFSNDKGNWKSRQAFKTAGDNFRMIDNNTIDIIVPYNEEASRIIEALNGETTISQALELQRKAQQYIVNVYDYTFKKLAENDALNEIKVRRDEKMYIYALKKEFYNNATGLSTEGKPQEAMFV